jgi:hypothetical protein
LERSSVIERGSVRIDESAAFVHRIAGHDGDIKCWRSRAVSVDGKID